MLITAHNLESVFDHRLATERNAMMLGNLSLMVAAHQLHPLQLTASLEQQALVSRARSSVPSSNGVVVDRAASQLAKYHGLTTQHLVAFADGGTVVDIGAGRSPFLSAFLGASETVAFDINGTHSKFQSDKGHTALVGNAKDLSTLITGSVRLLHASYSAPFWSVSEQEAAQTAREYARVLEVGGIALVGPTMLSTEHQHQERIIDLVKRGERGTRRPWPDAADAHASKIRHAFASVLLAGQQGASLELVGNRHTRPDRPDFKSRLPHLHVPNFLMFRKAAA